MRISCLKGDAGERRYAELCGDGKKIKIFLDGVEQREALIADEEEGFVRRVVLTQKGKLAYNPATEAVLEETVRGKVRVEIVD